MLESLSSEKLRRSRRAYLNPTNFLRGKRRRAVRLNFRAARFAFSLPPKPGDQLYKIFLCHCRAASGRPIHAAADVKKNRAPCARHWWIGIVADFDKPVISKITGTHLFVRVIIRWIFWINHNVPIVIRRSRVIAPNVCLSHLMVWIVAAGGQARLVTKNLTNLENACRSATVPLFLPKARLVLSGQPCAPRNAIFAKQHRKRASHGCPISATCTFKEP